MYIYCCVVCFLTHVSPDDDDDNDDGEDDEDDEDDVRLCFFSAARLHEVKVATHAGPGSRFAKSRTEAT